MDKTALANITVTNKNNLVKTTRVFKTGGQINILKWNRKLYNFNFNSWRAGGGGGVN